MSRRRSKASDTPVTTGEFYENLAASNPSLEKVASQERAKTTNVGGIKMAGLTAEQIQALMGSARTKGQYNDALVQFINSGEAGVCANEQWPEMATKKSATLKQGFENTKNSKTAPEGSELVKVLVNDEKVYLINMAAAGLAANTTEAEAVNEPAAATA